MYNCILLSSPNLNFYQISNSKAKFIATGIEYFNFQFVKKWGISGISWVWPKFWPPLTFLTKYNYTKLSIRKQDRYLPLGLGFRMVEVMQLGQICFSLFRCCIPCFQQPCQNRGALFLSFSFKKKKKKKT